MGGLLLAAVAVMIGLATTLAAGAALAHAAIARSLRSLALSGVLAASAALMASAVFVAAKWAESRSGWSDADGDGVQDGFANGSVDWFDVNLGDFATAYLALTVLVAVATVLLLRLIPGRVTHEPA